MLVASQTVSDERACPECGAVPADACTARFHELIALDHQRVVPYGAHHGEAFAAYALNHPAQYTTSLDQAWQALHAIVMRGLAPASVFEALRGGWGMPDGRIAPTRPTARVALPAVTIADLRDVPTGDYEQWLARWCRATLESWGVVSDAGAAP